jgi:hypothetical protein
MKFEVVYQDGERSNALEISFEIMCEFEDEFQISALEFESKLRVTWLSWCLHRALTRSGVAVKPYIEWRRTIAEINPMDDEPVNPTRTEA